ncbi:MAG TPA: hypothetical protein VJT72_00295 [Pseudonocardiaceae bacterium]|nr:hypothetical protein [Pseudonocardiaceae bacterium]
MPIRTHRGRTAVYRAFWGWPLRSPRHLTGTVVALIAIAVGVGLALPESRSANPTPATSANRPRVDPLPPATRMAVVPEPALGGLPQAPDPSAPAPAAALTVARSWVQAFLTVPKGINSARWAEQLRPYTTDELFPELGSVDPANVPTAKITGEPRTVSFSASSAEVDVPTSVVVVRLLLISTPTGWRVSGYQRAG